MNNTLKDKEQVEKYDSLELDDTYRGQSVILLRILSIVIFIIILMSEGVPSIDLVFDIIILLLISIPLSSWINNGKTWAIITTQIFFSLVLLRCVNIYLISFDFQNPQILWISSVPIYYIVMKSLGKSYKVEKERKKISIEKNSKLKNKDNGSTDASHYLYGGNFGFKYLNMKKIKSYLSEIFITLGVGIFTYYTYVGRTCSGPIFGSGRRCTDHNNIKVFAVLLITVGVLIFLRRYLYKIKLEK